MFATAVIVFREVLEAALVVTIVLVAAKGVCRGLWVSLGVVLGLPFTHKSYHASDDSCGRRHCSISSLS